MAKDNRFSGGKISWGSVLILLLLSYVAILSVMTNPQHALKAIESIASNASPGQTVPSPPRRPRQKRHHPRPFISVPPRDPSPVAPEIKEVKHEQKAAAAVGFSHRLSRGIVNNPPQSSGPPKVQCSTSRGNFTVELHPEICPRGAKQIATMVSTKFLSQGIAFWRVNPWITQFGADLSPEGRRKRGEEDPWKMVRKGLGNDPHPACKPRGFLNVSQCKAAQDDEELKASRKAAPWPRGTLAVIGGSALLVVRGANSQMGVSAHDCPAGVVVSGMQEVFDQLYDGYGNAIDNRGIKKGMGPDQRYSLKTYKDLFLCV